MQCIVYYSYSRISFMPVKKFAIIWNSLWPIELDDVKVKENCSRFDICMAYLMQRFLKDFMLFANFGRSTVIRTRRPVPERLSSI